MTGTGFGAYGLPLEAAVGAVPIEGTLLYPDGPGFAGNLASAPNDGGGLALGYVQLTITDLVFHPAAAT